AQRALVAFQPEDVIGLLRNDLSRDGTLAAHRVDGNDRALDRQQVEQFGDRDDLVGLFRDLHLTEHETLARHESRHHVNGAFTGFPTGAAYGLAVDRHHAFRDADQRRDPGDEAALELLGVERGENVTQVVVRRRAIAERPEPAEQVALGAAEAGDIDEGFGPRQHRKERQEEYFVQRIQDLAALPRIRQSLEMIEKGDRLEDRAAVGCHVVHGYP